MRGNNLGVCKLLARLALLVAIGLPSLANAAGSCTASTLAELKGCAASLGSYDSISLTADIACSGASCCGNNNAPLIDIQRLSNKTLFGNNHRITRGDNQRVCPALLIHDSQNIRIQEVVFDEDAADAPCEVTDDCPNTIRVSDATDVSLSSIDVVSGKAYVIYAWHVDGMELRDSLLINSGIIGFYVGHKDYGNSTRVKVLNSTFVETRTNAIAIEGVTGSQADDNQIVGNRLVGNHWHGLWTAPTGVYPGGQMLIAMADHLVIRDNIIGDGFCENCERHAVTGIELGMPNRPDSLQHIELTNNLVYNNHENSLYLNQGAKADATIRIVGNRLVNNGAAPAVSGAYFASNALLPTRAFLGWETAPTDWTSWQLCAAGSQVVRWCPGSGEAMDGQCALRMINQGASCSDSWRGVWTQGLYRAVGPGVKVYLSSWSRNGSSWTGMTCLVYQNSSHGELGQTCQNLSTEAVWRYGADPLIEATTPAGTAYVAVKFGATSGIVDVDNLRLTW